MKEVGLNLYSIRNLIKTEEEFLETAKKLKEMGYSYMQYSGGPFEVDRIKRVSEETGMPICLTHVPFDRIVNETEALMEEHAQFNCKNIGLGAMPIPTIIDETECKKAIELLNVAGEKMTKNGFKFFYHHHNYEFFKHGNQTVFDYMIENAPYINFTADTYWLQYGGVDILSTLEKLKGRIACVHLKDYKQRYNEETKKIEPIFSPVGEGLLNFKAIVEKLKTLGVEYYLVEQDNAALLPDTLGEVERSVKYIQKEL